MKVKGGGHYLRAVIDGAGTVYCKECLDFSKHVIPVQGLIFPKMPAKMGGKGFKIQASWGRVFDKMNAFQSKKEQNWSFQPKFKRINFPHCI